MDAAKFDVFISHSSEDAAIADAVRAALESDGIPCWIAPRNILAGQEWPGAIAQAIERCRILTLILSAKANLSPQIRNEVALAGGKGLALVPFRIESVQLNPSLAYFMTGVHWLDATKPPVEEHLRQLLVAVRAQLQANAPGQPRAGKPALADVSWQMAATSLMAVWPTLAMISAALLIDGLSTFLLIMIGMSAYGMSPSDFGYLIFAAAQIATGLATIRRQEWARFLGAGVCLVGIFMYINLLATRQDIIGQLGNATRTFEQITLILVLVLGMLFYVFSWQQDVLDRFSSRLDVDGSIKRTAKQACFVLMVGVVGAFDLIHFFTGAINRPAYWWVAIPVVGGTVGLMVYSNHIFQQHGLNARKLLS